MASSRAYQQTVEKPEHKFGSMENIIDAHLAQVADGMPIKFDDFKGLDKLAIDMKNCFVTVTEWKREHLLNSPETQAKIIDRLPEGMQLRFQERCAELYESNEEPTFAHLIKFLSSSVDMAYIRLRKKLLLKGCKHQSSAGTGRTSAWPGPARVTAFAAKSKHSYPSTGISRIKC